MYILTCLLIISPWFNKLKKKKDQDSSKTWKRKCINLKNKTSWFFQKTNKIDKTLTTNQDKETLEMERLQPQSCRKPILCISSQQLRKYRWSDHFLEPKITKTDWKDRKSEQSNTQKRKKDQIQMFV